jgi:uncharacterized membrane protein
MPDILPLVVVFFVGAVFSGYELLSTTYPMTCYFILRNSRSIYAYSIIYGIISIIFMEGIDYFGIFKCVVTPVLSNVWVQAVFVGISTKAFLHITHLRQIQTKNASYKTYAFLRSVLHPKTNQP